MPSNEAASLSVRWDVLKAEGAALLTLHGGLDAVSTPVAWEALEKELKARRIFQSGDRCESIWPIATARAWRCFTISMPDG